MLRSRQWWTNDEVQALLSLYAEDEIQWEVERHLQSYVTGLILTVLKTAMEMQTVTGLGEKIFLEKKFLGQTVPGNFGRNEA